MWTSNFPLLALLLLLNLMNPAFGNGQNDSLSVLAPKITQFKLSLHHLLEGARIRRKRQFLDTNAPHEQQMRFASSAQEDLPYLSDYNLTFWIPVWHQSQKQALIATKQGHLILFELADNDEKFARTIAVSEDEDAIIKAKAFSHYNEQWFVALQSDISGLPHIRLYQKIGRGLEKRQTIMLNGDSDIDLITVRNVHYLVVATYQTRTNQGYSYRAEVKLYQWIESQFDEIASRETYGALAVSCWVLDGSLYMAVGQEKDDEGDYSIGSPVYLYNAKEKNKLVMLEKLATYGPKKVLHFYVSNNHYAIFIGLSDAVIYWWSSGQFLAWQTIKGTANAVDVSVLTLENGEVAIVIALVEEALFLTLDVSGYYIISFVMSFAGSSLSSLQFMYSGQAYYALAVFAESFRHRSHSIYKLTVEPYNLMTGSSLDSLQECLSSMNELLDERETDLKFVNSELGRVWLKGENQRITSSVHVTGDLSSTLNTIVRQILIVVEHKLLIDSPSRDQVVEELSKSMSLTNNIRNDLDDIVLKSPPQDITGTLQFLEPIAIPSLNMKSSDLDVPINGIFATSLQDHALRKNGDQLFTGPVLAGNIHTEQMNLESLNGIFLDDLLLLKGQQTVAGLLKFSSVHSSALSVPNLNSIPVENIVLTHSDQQIFDLKSASYLNSLVIDVHKETNGKNLEEVQNKIVLTHTDDDIMGRLTWNSSVTIVGDLFAPGSINGQVDLSKMAQDSVQKHIQQDLTGSLFFTTPQAVSADVTVTGFINDVDIQHLLTKDTVQTISGSIAFREPLFVHSDLFTDSVNGVDLSESAVLKSPPFTHYDQFVSGFKMFVSDLNVDSVDMTEYVTLDGVDPSLLMQDIVRHKEGVVKENRTTFGNVVVTGDVTALGGLNGHEVMDLKHMFWLKSKPQTIEADVRFEKVSVENDLEAERINFLNLDKDVVRSFGNETIDSEKSFDHIINVRRLEQSRGILINGIDIFSFKTELEREGHEWNVHGIKIFESVEVLGDLSMKELSDLYGTKELMQLKAFQTVLGDVEFSSELTNALGSSRAKDLFFDSINGHNFRNYLENAVMSSASRTISDKTFSQLEGSNMQLHNGSTIGKKSLFEFLPRIVTLNSMQEIPSPKIFNSAVHFTNEVVVTDLNGLDISSYASRVVLKDDFKVIAAHKEFSGTVEMDFVFVQNYVNGIKIEKLAENAFFKTGDNEVTARMRFLRDADIGQLLTNSINGLNMSNLALTNRDEVLGSSWFLSDVTCLGDLFVTGYINGCDLSKIQRNAFYTNKTQHVISTEISVDSIQVLGNIVILNSSRHSEVDILKRSLILISEEEVLEADIVIDSSVFAMDLHVANFLNGVNLPFIFSDAVRHSVPQEIKGFKAFNDLTMSVLRTRGIFVERNLAGVNIQELLLKAVLKNGHQIIAGEKIFQSENLRMDVVTVQGRLNSLHLPQDIVLTGTSEIITSPTFFMSDIYLNNELLVRGKINRIDLDDFLKNRISLTADETISSPLTFWEDAVVNGNVDINGMINDVALEMVVNLGQLHPVNGYKSFTNLKVTGSLHTSQVNGYDPIKLENDILKFNKPEFVNEIQVFEKPLQINTLSADWINGISMTKLSALAYSILDGLRSILHVFEDVTSTVQEQLGRQLSASGTQLSKFAYFILVQELDLGAASKILHGYRFEHFSSEFSHSMVIWTSQKHCAYMEKCCETEFTYWMRVRRSGHVMVDGEAEMGRYYPIHNPAPVMYDKDFFIWTNSSQLQPKWCRAKGKAKMQLASFSNEGRMEVFMEIQNSPFLSEVKTFRSGSLYAVAGFFYDPVEGEYRSTAVYSFNEVKRDWSEHQILPAYGVLSLDITTGKNGEILLALGTGMETTPESYSVIYKWNDDDKLFVISQSVPSRFVTSTVWIHHESSLLLAMSEVEHWPKKDTDCFEHISGGQINIYLYEGYAKWIQSIPLEGVASMVSFTISGDIFLAAASSQLQTVNIYERKGYAGFALLQSIFAGEVRHLNTYSVGSDLFMTVAKASGSSEILKAITQGRSDPAHLGYKRLISDQNDETSLEEKIVSRCR